MLELKNIKKTYRVGDVETRALDDISVSFREQEFVAILGTSGSGKTTCLNIIGGLDRYDSGDLIINGKSTKNFKDREWDAYRNNSIGFIFQSYNLISHLSIVANVEMGMTLSGVSAAEKHRRAQEALEKVGLKDHLHKKPNQLSGGQMQRVAIARALANDPDILLCDEPTGALDTVTSVQIMDLIKEIAGDKLVIMVTHNPELAEKYADRIVKFQDGKIVSDSNPYSFEKENKEFSLKKTSMSFLTALKLSANNIRTKLGRTFLTSFASSIGIIGIAVILSLSVGFQMQIDKFEADTLQQMPIIISQQSMNLDTDTMIKMGEEQKKYEDYPDEKKIYLFDSMQDTMTHTNKFTDEYLEYVNNMDSSLCKGVTYSRLVNMNMIRKDGENYIPVTSANINWSSYPVSLNENKHSLMNEHYDVLTGTMPETPNDLMLVVDTKNRINKAVMKELGFDADNLEEIDFNEIIGKELKVVMNDDYYVKTEYGTYSYNTDLAAMYNAENTLTLRISCIVRPKEDSPTSMMSEGGGVAYNDELAQLVIDNSKNSEIVKAQEQSDVNVLSMEAMDEETKKQTIAYLGGNEIPYAIQLYPYDFESKDKMLEYLDKYNESLEADDQIIYTDMASMISGMSDGIMDGITIVLIAFAGTNLIVSLIMIAIITYTSVLERTKEIGILKALGARKKDITRVFDAETFILGVTSGMLGIIIAKLLTFPINAIIYSLTDLKNVAHLKISHALILVAISTILTMLGGHIPARMAAKRDAVEALRSE
ncbi:ATP-binding cassette domain-containing protein [Porcipelethomonas ammoniilytica]|uniref:ABC transporter ATP-binding protein/permease n=1 Tax=Porcipelethomonas ammoniilytica TaxID=2981722 RepID=UPI000822BF7F|nr:ABC transporter ATP-binding protein/permease [Porcipelethomonas ammoniilytica]MCU6720359.1 ATP-binding cassette domain-containing protein [Porcipelethomonas ammoniilytica]SCJ10634.1 Macrolide export ATP-binding/permease protein MacB [uncultured Ruminococcus sp.]